MTRIQLARLLALGTCAVPLTACTTIPKAEVDRFQKAVQAAQEAGEEILIDYSSIRDEARALEAQAEPDPLEDLLFDPSKIQAPSVSNRDVISRMRAWEVMARYSNALVAVASGESQGQLAQEAGGLLDSLTAVTGATLPPGVGAAVKEAAELIQKEMRARRFREAITIADPKMKEITEAMITDTGNFFGIRLSLYQRSLDPLRDPVGDRINRFEQIAAPTAFQYDENDRDPEPNSFSGLVGRLNAASKALLGDLHEPYIPASPGTAPYTQQVGEQLLQIVLEDEAASASREALDQAFQAYKEALTAYVVLLRQMRAAHEAILAIIAANSARMPDVVEPLLDAAIRVRTAIKASS